MMRVIIIAGGSVPRDLAAAHPLDAKALLPVGGATLLQTAQEAVREMAQSTAVVASESLAPHVAPHARHVAAGTHLVDNILRGYQFHGSDESAEYLVLSPDLPFVSPESLVQFVEQARLQCELGIPVVLRETFQRHFPEAPNKFERLSGQELTMGSAMYMTGRILRSNIPLWQDLYNARKHPHRLAAMLGLRIAVGFLTGRLRLESLEQRASQLCGGRVRALFSDHAGLAYDVDNRENYEYAVAHKSRLEDR